MGLKKHNTNTFVMWTILFSFIMMLSIEATPRESFIEEINKEFTTYSDKFNNQKMLINQIEKEVSAKLLLSNDNYANAKMILRDTATLMNNFEQAQVDKKDLILVDIGFNLNQANENLQKVLRSIE